MAGNLRQYNKDKPNPFGIKAFLRTSSDGVVHDILLYQGKSTFMEHHLQLTKVEARYLGVSGQVVSILSRTIQKHNGVVPVVFADNWFSGIDLVRILKERGVRYCGTIKENRYLQIYSGV